MERRNPGGASGFTLLELLLAASVFSLLGLAIGAFYVFAVQRMEEGFSRSELYRNGSLVLQALGGAIGQSKGVEIPAEGEPSGRESITVRFGPEPYVDENLNGMFDSTGAGGSCAPRECFLDLNGNGVWDEQMRPQRSFRLHRGALQVRQGDASRPWAPYLDDRYPGEAASSVWMESLVFLVDDRDPDLLHIRFSLRDDRGTPENAGDDLTRTFAAEVRRGG